MSTIPTGSTLGLQMVGGGASLEEVGLWAMGPLPDPPTCEPAVTGSAHHCHHHIPPRPPGRHGLSSSTVSHSLAQLWRLSQALCDTAVSEVADTVKSPSEGLGQGPLHTRCVPRPLLGATSPEEPGPGITKSAPAESLCGRRSYLCNVF